MDYHLINFTKKFFLGGIVGLLSTGETYPLLTSLITGLGSLPVFERYFFEDRWEEVYKRSPAQTAGLYAGLSLAKILTQ